MSAVEQGSSDGRVGEILRAIVALSLAAIIVFAPLYRQSLGGREQWVPRWVMFSGKGLGYYSIRFEAVTPEKSRHVVDWDLVYPPKKELKHPVRARRISELRQLYSLATQVCRKLGPKAQVYLFARRAVRSGWEQVTDPKLDMCKRSNRRKLLGVSSRNVRRRPVAR